MHQQSSTFVRLAFVLSLTLVAAVGLSGCFNISRDFDFPLINDQTFVLATIPGLAGNPDIPAEFVELAELYESGDLGIPEDVDITDLNQEQWEQVPPEAQQAYADLFGLDEIPTNIEDIDIDIADLDLSAIDPDLLAQYADTQTKQAEIPPIDQVIPIDAAQFNLDTILTDALAEAGVPWARNFFDITGIQLSQLNLSSPTDFTGITTLELSIYKVDDPEGGITLSPVGDTIEGNTITLASPPDSNLLDLMDGSALEARITAAGFPTSILPDILTSIVSTEDTQLTLTLTADATVTVKINIHLF
jgi:hypothetical protein